MIAETLEQSVNKLRHLLEGDAENWHHSAPAVLHDIEADIERVRGLENVAEIRADILDVYAEGARARFGCPTEAPHGRA